MKLFSRRNVLFFFSLVCLAGVSWSLIYLFFSLGSAAQLRNSSANGTTPTATLPPIATPGITPSLSNRGCTLSQHGFEGGIVFPRWSNRGYGGNDTAWLQELPQMKAQTSACWIEMPVLFQQTSLTSTDVSIGSSTPSSSSFSYGIRYARSQGLHVFISLLVTIPGGSDHWVGKVQLTTPGEQQQWFANYWQTIKPYVVAAQQAGADQLAIGTEIQWLEDHAPAALWNNLIAQVHSVFTGTLTYDVNWTALNEPPLAWMRNPLLKMIGVSAYVPLLNSAKRVDPQQMPALWSNKVKSLLDLFSTRLGEPVFVSEVGYRDTADNFYNPFLITSSAASDQQEQQGACEAVLQNVLTDSHILGNFFWAWDGAGRLNLKNSLATQTIKHYYQSLSA